MSYGQVWYEDRHGRPYYLVSGMRVYRGTEKQASPSRISQVTSSSHSKSHYAGRYSQAAGPASYSHHTTASAAYEGYAASVPRVRWADEVSEGRDRSWSPDKHSRRRSIRESTPSIVPWPSYEDNKPFDHHTKHYGKGSHEHITIINAEPGQRSKRYNDLYYRDNLAPEPRRRSSSRESYVLEDERSSRARRPTSYVGNSRHYY